MNNLYKKLYDFKNLDDAELKAVIDAQDTNLLFELADMRRREYYGNKVYIRGLIEFSNYCKNDCYYCGIRRSNTGLCRYRLTKEEILECCTEGHRLGFRTFVLQSGEDMSYNDKSMCDIIYSIKSAHPDCAVTLSVGEKSFDTYKAYKSAGADRYLLRHETADPTHYASLHPEGMTLQARKKCLYDLKELGFAVGAGFMVGSPYQTLDNLVSDLRFLQEFEPDMIGIGPFLPHKDTPFKDESKGSLKRCLNIISIVRLMLPYALIPSTTALATIAPDGRERGILAGANVVMPNLSPLSVREHYTLYNDKASMGSEAAEAKEELQKRMADIGYEIVTDIGHPNKK